MKKTLSIILAFFSYSSLYGGESLVDSDFIHNQLLRNANWAALHGAEDSYIGAGMLYYAIVYSMKAKTCVCLGSGDGFVPRIMRQAQRDCNLTPSKTILVDANTGKWGRPNWLHPASYFRSQYPEIEIVLDTTHNVALHRAQEWSIDYLHIDADRTAKGAFQDFLDFLPYMSRNGVITLHDVGGNRPCSRTLSMIKEMGYPVISFSSLGTGTAIILLQ